MKLRNVQLPTFYLKHCVCMDNYQTKKKTYGISQSCMEVLSTWVMLLFFLVSFLTVENTAEAILVRTFLCRFSSEWAESKWLHRSDIPTHQQQPPNWCPFLTQQISLCLFLLPAGHHLPLSNAVSSPIPYLHTYVNNNNKFMSAWSFYF